MIDSSWPARFLDFLELVDRHEAPHGLYGMLRAHVPEGPLRTYAHILSDRGKLDLLKQCGFANPTSERGYLGPSTGRRPDTLRFDARSRRVSIEILDYATTKVRHYGSAFRRDKRHHKPVRDSFFDLDTLVPKLRESHSAVNALLLIAHFASPREVTGVLGKSVEPAFQERYALEYCTREWDDRYGRGFRTALHLWTPRG